FFFQAEDGIRDRNVTGVQTCALPIYKTPNNSLKAGNSFIMAGKTMKAKPTPPSTTSPIGTPCCVAIKPNTENTPIPANNSNPELLNPVIKALFVISDFFGRYLE